MTDTVTVKPLVWDQDGRRLHLDDTMAMSKSYDWDGYELLRQEAYGLGASYMIWPDHIGSKSFNLYGDADGLYMQDLTEAEAKAAAQNDYERRIRAALEPQTPAQAALALRNIEPDDGFWRSCSGCHETVDGQETGWYAYSPIFKCHLGAGCGECGGLGAVWDDTDYEDMARAIAGGE